MSLRLQFKAARTCYDAFILGAMNGCNQLCVGCSNYRNEIIKKPQHSMGRKFQCEHPTPKGIPMPNPSPKSNARGRQASQDEDTCSSREKENIIVRRRKKRNVKKDDNEKTLLRSRLDRAEKMLAYYEKLCNDQGDNIQELETKLNESEMKLHAATKLVEEQAEELRNEKRRSLQSRSTLKRSYKTISDLKVSCTAKMF